MLCVFVFPLCLLLPSVVGSGYPDFGEDYDYYRYVCEGDACASSTIYLGFDKNIQVPNQTVTYEEYESFDVNTAGLLADCAPSLSIGDIASRMKSCKEVHWKYEDACKYRKKGWLDQDGKTVNESLGTDFMAIEGVSENILKCLDWDGMDYYDYDYDYGYYNDDYDYYDINDMEESDDVQVRAKREQKTNATEFMIQKTRLKRNIDKKAYIRKEENKHVKKRGNRKGKNKGKFGRKSGKKGKKSGKKGKKHGQRRKKSAIKGKKGGKGRSNSGKRKHRGAKKANERKKNGQNKKKKGNNKKNENKKKKEERKKKKKERKLLKRIGYDSMPSEDTLSKLYCVERAIQYGLEKCGVRIFKNLEHP